MPGKLLEVSRRYLPPFLSYRENPGREQNLYPTSAVCIRSSLEIGFVPQPTIHLCMIFPVLSLLSLIQVTIKGVQVKSGQFFLLQYFREGTTSSAKGAKVPR